MNDSKIRRGGYGSRVFSLTQRKGLRAILSWVYPPAPFVNCIPRRVKRSLHREIFARGNSILDIGAGLSKGPGSWLWSMYEFNEIKITRLDIVPGPNIDIVADATQLSPSLGIFDCVVLQAVPEHVKDVRALFDSALSVTKLGGLIYIEMPFLQGEHGDPDDYWRATSSGLREYFPGCEVVSVGVSGGAFGALIWILTELMSGLMHYILLKYFVKFILRWLFSPFRYLDLLFYRFDFQKSLACENYILLKKVVF